MIPSLIAMGLITPIFIPKMARSAKDEKTVGELYQKMVSNNEMSISVASSNLFVALVDCQQILD